VGYAAQSPSRYAVALTTGIGAFVALVTVCVSFALIVSFHARFYKLGAEAVATLTTAVPIVTSVLYGMAWWVAAAVTGRRWLFVVAIGSFVAAILMAVAPLCWF
jgi:hypothetical protein